MVNYCPVLQYDPNARLIVVDVKKEIGDRKTDVTQMAYYMEKDVRVNVTEPTKRELSSPDLFSTLFRFCSTGESSASVQEPGEV